MVLVLCMCSPRLRGPLGVRGGVEMVEVLEEEEQEVLVVVVLVYHQVVVLA